MTGSRGALIPAIVAGIVMLAIEVFLHDIGVRDLGSWAIAAVVVAGLVSLALVVPEDSPARSMLWFVAVPVAGCVIVYDLVDISLAPFLDSEWASAGIAMLFLVLFECMIFARRRRKD
jgi:peptidoglycan/LPS O-acetylase OafA/YrhL